MNLTGKSAETVDIDCYGAIQAGNTVVIGHRHCHFEEGNNIMRKKTPLAAALIMAAVPGLLYASTGSASASWTDPCSHGNDGLYHCYNVRGAKVVYDYAADYSPRPAHPMWSNPSSFQCRTDAAPGSSWYYAGNHPGRWLWTVADDGAHGAMKDTDIYSETDTVSPCP